MPVDTRGKDKASDKSSSSTASSSGITTLEKMLTKQSTETPNLQAMLKSFENKLSTMASQDYFDKKFKDSETVLLKQLEKVKGEIQEQIQKDITEVRKEVRDLQAKVDSVHSEQSKDKTLISDLSIKVDNLEKQNGNLKKSNQKLREALNERLMCQESHANRINDLEQYSRRNSIRIYGINDSNPSETPFETAVIVAEKLSAKLKLSIEVRDIDIAHRMGRFLKEGNRPIICKFVSRFKKVEVIKSRRLLKGTPIVIKEDLTLRNMQRLQEVQDVENVTKAWSDDGKIIALLDSTDKVLITYKTDLTKPIKPPKKKKQLKISETALGTTTGTIEVTEAVVDAGSGDEMGSGDETGEIIQD